MAQGLVLGQYFTLFFFFTQYGCSSCTRTKLRFVFPLNLTHSIAVRLAPRQSFALLILVTCSIATRLALGQSLTLLILAIQEQV